MYYAAWEGHLECMKLLTPYTKRRTATVQIGVGSLAPLASSSAPGPMALDPDAIPILELPPPIIPLRRYGHNFLDKKTVVQITFGDGGSDQPLVFFHGGKYPAARLTMSSKVVSDLIPKNIMLPFQEDTRLVSFQVDNLDSFTLEFDVFPTYGAKVIAKTVVLPDTFRSSLSKSADTSCLPLFDIRLRAIGQISFQTQVIKPFQGTPLELTDFETYWKATSQFDTTPNTFVTGSSLSGDFVRVYVQHTSDSVPVLWPVWTINCGGIDVPIPRITLEQFRTVTSQSLARAELTSVPTSTAEHLGDVHRVLATSGITLHEALSILPIRMHVNIQVVYPTPDQERTFNLGPSADLNTFVDAILTVVFDHARAQRAQSPDAVRSVVFSSYNPSLCTALNWKQPNFPVFLCNDLGRHDLADGGAVESTFDISGRRTTSIKEVVRTAQSNNFMGLICCSRLLVCFSAASMGYQATGPVPFSLSSFANRCGDRTWSPPL